MSSHLKYCRSPQYADNTQIYYSFNYCDLDKAVKNINSHRAAISRDFNAYGLIINESKITILVFGSHRHILSNQSFNIELNNIFSEPVTTCNNFDFKLDADLRFSSHVGI